MSLRKVRSLPSLRVLAEVSSPLVRIPPPSFTYQTRQVHNTKKNEHSPMLSSDSHASFTRMSLKTLKNECRTRGLKVSGKKTELVERILLFEGSSSKKLHTSAVQQAKNDSSHIDSMKIPNVAKLEAEAESRKTDYIVKVPSIVNNAATEPKTKIEKDYEKKLQPADKKPLAENVGTVATPDADNVIQTPSVSDPIKVVNPEEELRSGFSEQGRNYSQQDEELTSRDKKFLLGFAGTVAAWWSLRFWKKEESKK
ncbi:Aim34 [Kluyveromyces lactis]|nr:Aim34 [Kluyveromyces lactis]